MRARLSPLLVVLCCQAVLLFWNLDLLPVWGDELFTLGTVANPPSKILQITRGDIHPPLYYLLLHAWSGLPLPGTSIARLRAFSGVAALLATFLLDWFWLRRLKTSRRALALALFAFSPCLLLFGRMARSYSLQTAVALLAISLLLRWLRTKSRPAPAFAAVTLLLYTHYLPGIAVLAGFSVAAWERLGWVRLTSLCAAAALAYTPWLLALGEALRNWGQASGFQSQYTLTGNLAVEQILKIASGLTSLTIGESFSVFSLALVPVVLLLAWRGYRLGTPRPGLLLMAVIGFAGASRWVTWPFIGARLLWLLPWLTLAVALGLMRRETPFRRLAAAAILLSFASSTVLYFRRENFVNLGYTSPIREIAARLKLEASPQDLILIDGYGMEVQPARFYLSDSMRARTVLSGTAEALRSLARTSPAVWLVRGARDVSPGQLLTALETGICQDRNRDETLYQPYAPWQLAALAWMTHSRPPESAVRLTRCAIAPGAHH